MLARATPYVFGLMAAVLSAAACRQAVDLKQTVEITDISAGWFDAGIQAGKNKLVPSVTFRMKQKPDAKISSVSLNIVFRAEADQENADDVFVQRVEFKGTETEPITVRAKYGYTADPPQSRAEMLQNSQFRDMEAQIFARQSSAQWVELQRVKIPRQLLTQ
jgi:hypothetical protein